MILSGSYRKRKTKTGHDWQITVELPKDPITGKRVRRYKTVEGTKKEAERAMRDFINELEKGFGMTNSKITVDPHLLCKSVFGFVVFVLGVCV